MRGSAPFGGFGGNMAASLKVGVGRENIWRKPRRSQCPQVRKIRLTPTVLGGPSADLSLSFFNPLSF